MSRPKSAARILLDQERAIRKESREQKRIEKEAQRVAREAKRQARETYDAKNGGDYAMKRSEDQSRRDIYCSVCDQRKSWGQFMPGTPAVCCDCAALESNGRATPAEPNGNHGCGPEAQLALFES